MNPFDPRPYVPHRHGRGRGGGGVIPATNMAPMMEFMNGIMNGPLESVNVETAVEGDLGALDLTLEPVCRC